MRHEATLRSAARGRPCLPPARWTGGIERALEWAFRNERVGLDHPSASVAPAGPSYGLEYVAIRQAELGARVDGGGVSAAHHDAEAIAAAVGRLPWWLAVTIAESARSGSRPLGLAMAEVRVEPAAWQAGAHGYSARTEVVERIEVKARGRGGRASTREVRWCPVVYRPSLARIEADRETYLRWWFAVVDLSVGLRGKLDQWALTDELPPMRPWLEERC